MRPARKVFFFVLLILAAGLLAGFDSAQGAEDLVVAVDKSTMVKALGLVALGILGEIWRNQRANFRSINAISRELKELKGFCKGKHADCGLDSEEQE